jgi:hypothetical protein
MDIYLPELVVITKRGKTVTLSYKEVQKPQLMQFIITKVETLHKY